MAKDNDDNSQEEKEYSVDPILLSSQTARHIVRLATHKISEYDLYDRYMTTVGSLLFIPNPKAEVARNIIALKGAKLLKEDPEGVFASTSTAIKQIRHVSFEDASAETVELATQPTVFAKAAGLDRALGIACCSTSTSCKCTSSSSSSSIKL